MYKKGSNEKELNVFLVFFLHLCSASKIYLVILDHILIFSILISVFNCSIWNIAVKKELKNGSNLQPFYLNNHEDTPRTKDQSNKD